MPDEGKTRKHGAEYHRQLREAHLGIDAQTLGLRAIEIMDRTKGDAPMLPELLARIPADELLRSSSAGAWEGD